MHIGIDMIGTQTPGSRNRGIGRYSNSLAKAIIEQARDHRITLIYHEGLPIDPVPGAVSKYVVSRRDSVRHSENVEAFLRENPLKLDAYLLTSPMETGSGFAPPTKPLRGMVMSCVCYDIIPALFPDRYFANKSDYQSEYFHFLQRMLQYDRLLCISEATRSDLISYYHYPETRAVNIGTSCDEQLFTPGETPKYLLNRLGIHGPYLLSVTGMDSRKNYLGIVRAFSSLPTTLRNKYQLVLTCKMTPDEENRLRVFAESLGVSDKLVLTNFVTDYELRDLYRGCTLFIFPSTYEGFGLPLLEAMSCGAPVMGGNNSAQVELVRDVGVLVNAGDDNDIAEKLRDVLLDSTELQAMRRRSLAQATNYRWSMTADRALNAIESAHQQLAQRKLYAYKPAIAIVTPLPPQQSGIADYVLSLGEALEDYYRIDYYHDASCYPYLRLSFDQVRVFDARLLPLRDRSVHYHQILYQMGNSACHHFMVDLFYKCPGVVTLHEFFLGNECHNRLASQGAMGPKLFREVIMREWKAHHVDPVPESSSTVELFYWARSRGISFTKEFLEIAPGIVVHSKWVFDRAAQLEPDVLSRMALIPFGANLRILSNQEKYKIRKSFGLSESSLILGSFGVIHPNKMNLETLSAIEPLLRERPNVQVVFAGRIDDESFKLKVHELGLQPFIRLFENCNYQDFMNLIAITDIGINLRRPPTNGETSATLFQLLSHGVATIVTDTGTFAELPQSAVVRIPYDGNFHHQLTRTLFELAIDDSRRARLGAEAQKFIREKHDWKMIAEQYAAFLDRTARNRSWVHPVSAPIRRNKVA